MTVKNADYVKIVNATYRATGSIGPKAIVPKIVPRVAKKSDRILDFGAGTKAIHTKALRKQGYNVTAYDIGANIDPAIHDPNALAKKWDVVYASNVLNVQPSPADLISLVMLLAQIVKKGGHLIANYPPSPRKSGLTVAAVDAILQSHFATATRVPGVSSPTWICRK
jgi:uncharacterized UPF0146 family protein